MFHFLVQRRNRRRKFAVLARTYARSSFTKAVLVSVGLCVSVCVFSAPKPPQLHIHTHTRTQQPQL